MESRKWKELVCRRKTKQLWLRGSIAERLGAGFGASGPEFKD